VTTSFNEMTHANIYLDGHVFIWHKETGQLIEKLEAHKGCCNAIAWSPTNPSMFASAGDDHKVRM
jgi:WD40 repeat protein